MAQFDAPPSAALAKMLSGYEDRISALEKRDVLLNATFGPGLTVEQAYEQLQNQAVPAVGNSPTATGFTLTTIYQTLASVDIAIPAGYTRALVNAQMFLSSSTNAGGGDFLRGRIVSGVNTSPEVVGLMPSTNPWATVGAFGSFSLTGISGTLTLSGQARLDTGPGDTSLTRCFVVAMVLFLK